jgi:hypothetical protein
MSDTTAPSNSLAENPAIRHDPQKGPLVLRWLLPSLAAVLFGPLVALPVAALRDSTGGPDATLLLSESPILGIAALIGIAIVAAVGGAITGRLTAHGTGRTFAGLCIAWAAMRTGDSWRLFEMHGAGAAIPLAIEGLLVAVAGFTIATVLTIGGGRHTVETFKADLREAVGSANGAIGVVIGVAAGIAGAVLVGLDGARGQCLAAGFFGSLLAAVGVHLATPTLSLEQARLRSIAAVCVLMVVGPLTVYAFPGGGAAADAARGGTLVGPSIVQPLDWLVGIFLGIPTGLGWVGSVSEKAHQQAQSPTRKPRPTR